LRPFGVGGKSKSKKKGTTPRIRVEEEEVLGRENSRYKKY